MTRADCEERIGRKTFDARPAGGKRPGVENVSGRHNVLGGDILSSVWSTILDESFFPGHAGPGVPHSTRSAVLLHSGHLATGVLEPSGAHPPPSHAYPHNQEQVAARGRAVLEWVGGRVVAVIIGRLDQLPGKSASPVMGGRWSVPAERFPSES